MLTHVDLFSGIGGFALSAQWAGFRTVAFCEIDPFCQEVLKARFGAIADAEDERLQGFRPSGEQKPRTYGEAGLSLCRNSRPLLLSDIRALDGTRFRGATLLTGGFPCQPFSVAGKRKGKDDSRHLWPEMLRVISEGRPAWIVGENVAGIVNMELEQVCLDLEGEGYEVQPIIIPACAVNAPHRRDRVWICGHSSELGLSRINGRRTGKKPSDRHSTTQHATDDSADNELSTRNPKRRFGTRVGKVGEVQAGPGSNPDGSNSDAPDVEIGGRRQEYQDAGGEGEGAIAPEEWRGLTNQGWDVTWPEVATRLCRVDDGLPAWIHARRVARLKALGNAIVPQVAYEIIRAIAEIERGNAMKDCGGDGEREVEDAGN
ncbi:MAG: DNA cytosine methyltransferase [Candidatus Aminicenantales bacterium]